jgi:methylthioribulose-1-phosphate dehydratase
VDKNPSDETGLHCEIYRQDPEVGCVLHVHSIVGTALSMQEPLAKEFEFRGFEMQKAIANCRSHVEVVRIPILENSQDMDEIIEVMQQRVSELNQVKAFYLRGHGLYTWAYNLAQARKSLEAIEFLLNVKANMIQLGNSLVQPTN